jgi:hypothetical protein
LKPDELATLEQMACILAGSCKVLPPFVRFLPLYSNPRAAHYPDGEIENYCSFPSTCRSVREAIQKELAGGLAYLFVQGVVGTLNDPSITSCRETAGRPVPMLCVSCPGFAPAHPPAMLACQRFVNERARKDRDRLVPVRKLSRR